MSELPTLLVGDLRKPAQLEKLKCEISAVAKSGNSLSTHSWGFALDSDTSRNAFGDTTPHFAHTPQVLNAFEAEGWTWGGNWKKPDGMHWQAANV
jgi:hypothetical protein